jgi:hypothetical protein
VFFATEVQEGVPSAHGRSSRSRRRSR